MNYGADNLLTVRVDSNETLDQPPFGFVIDYMTYGGIYRDVYLEVKNSIYIEDIFLKPKFAETVTTKGMDAKAIAQMQVFGILASEVTYSVKAQEAISAGQVGIRRSWMIRSFWKPRSQRHPLAHQLRMSCSGILKAQRSMR